MAERTAPSTAAVAIATAILAGLGGYFLGQASSLGVFGGRKSTISNSAASESELDSDLEDESDVNGEEQESVTGLKAFAESKEEFKMVLVVRTDLGMGKGKIAAQCSHATLACYTTLQNSSAGTTILKRWKQRGQAKVALQVKSEDDLELLQAQAMSLGICAQIIHDAGRTQIASGSATVLGVGPAPKSAIDQVTGQLKLL